MTVTTTPDTLRPIRLMRNASVYHRLLRHKFSVPRKLVNPAIRSLKHLVNPSERATRTRLARGLAGSSAADKSLAENGYVLFGPEDLPLLGAALDNHQDELWGRIRKAGDGADANKSMLRTVVSDNGFFDMPDLMRFAISRPIAELATRYFGRVPLLTAYSLWWSPPNDSLKQSQLYHCDGEDARQLKFFFNLTEVTPENGPFTLLPGDVSDRIKAANGIDAGKVTDEEIAASGGAGSELVLTGPRGAGACVDTCRCLHFGSRGNTKDRVVLMMRFNDHLAPNVDMPDWHLRAGELAGELDDVQKLMLGIQPD